MILTCSTCGHRGEDGKDYNHDCYWVFRERGDNARMAKRGYSREFTPKTERRVRFEVDRIPPVLYEKVLARAKREGISLRALTLTLWKEWVERAEEP